MECLSSIWLTHTTWAFVSQNHYSISFYPCTVSFWLRRCVWKVFLRMSMALHLVMEGSRGLKLSYTIFYYFFGNSPSCCIDVVIIKKIAQIIKFINTTRISYLKTRRFRVLTGLFMMPFKRVKNKSYAN